MFCGSRLRSISKHLEGFTITVNWQENAISLSSRRLYVAVKYEESIPVKVYVKLGHNINGFRAQFTRSQKNKYVFFLDFFECVVYITLSNSFLHILRFKALCGRAAVMGKCVACL